MKSSIPGIVFGIVIFFVLQMILPFPYGLVLGVISCGLIIWYAVKHASRGKDSLLNYRRNDPLNEKEREQNDEAQRILDKQTIEDTISHEEYKKRKKEFEEAEYNVRKCSVCGSEDFEFISKRIEKTGESISDKEFYRCKKCGAK